MHQPPQYEPNRPEVLAEELSAREQYKHYSMQGVTEVKPQPGFPSEETEDKRRRTKADYRPISMRWPFVSCLLLLILAAMGLVAWTQRSLKGTDSTATIEQRQVLEERSFVSSNVADEILHIRQDAVPSPVPTEAAPNPEATPEAVPEPAPEPTETVGNGNDDDNGDAAARLRTTTEETSSEFTTTVTIPGSSIVETETVQVTIDTEIITDITTTIVDTETVVTSVVTSQVVPTTEFSTLSDGSVSTIVNENTIQATIEATATNTVSRTTVVLATIPAGQTATEIVRTRTGPPQVYVSTGTTTLINIYTPITIVSTPSPTTRVTTLPPTRTVLTSVSTPTSSTDRIVIETTTLSFSAVSYFLGKFLPPILAILLGIPIRALDCAAKLYHPFEALSQSRGVPGPASLNLHFEGWGGFFLPFKLMGKSYPATGLTTLLVCISAFLTPVATEAIGMKIHGQCSANAIDGCGLKLGINTIASGVLIAMLAVLALLVLVLLGVLARWRSGVFADPWCVAGMAALARNPDVRSSNEDVKSVVAEKHLRHGLVPRRRRPRRVRPRPRRRGRQESAGPARRRRLGRPADRGGDAAPGRQAAEAAQPLHCVDVVVAHPVRRCALRHRGTRVVLSHHQEAAARSAALRRQPEVRRTFRLLGPRRRRHLCLRVSVLQYVPCVAVIAPYRLMAKRAQPARRSILVTLPTNSFSGIATGIRTGDPVLFVVALMAVLSEFLPILLANVPYNLTQTKLTHDICARTSAGLLVLMAAVVVGSLFIRWPDMPVDPRSVGGAMWYVSESRWVSGLGGVAAMDKKERRKRIKELGGRWFYGNVFGMRGEQLGVEVEDGYRSGYGPGQTAEYRGPY
ncbi:conserved hypothetical protein [Verticillium alfalfae VaMs.102]|uniref:Zonadhesin n=1 Tax=Verticillium alfalfae (strain VaMs.102 / ATCC MYA-4576 / FGSC 10136) TaxID=526221 RepID=C9SW86_VERA1|nr:conserved hypothetical protein [Verticillium alfalfae VaMs.102]EEY23051.1 conserved hypothetical protein [Verticillium alfalfae VaMs.102]